MKRKNIVYNTKENQNIIFSWLFESNILVNKNMSTKQENTIKIPLF